MTESSAPQPATLRRRTAAFALDYFVIAGYLLVLVGVGTLLRAAAPSVTDALFGNPFLGEFVGFLLITLPVLLYFALTEASPAQGTLGKRRVGIKVVETDGGRIGLGRSIVRSALKFLPWELAHAMIWQFSAAGPNPPAILDAGLVLVWGWSGSTWSAPWWMRSDALSTTASRARKSSASSRSRPISRPFAARMAL